MYRILQAAAISSDSFCGCNRAILYSNRQALSGPEPIHKDMNTRTVDTDQLKQAAAAAALELVPRDCVIGVGTGSTTNFFIDLLGDIRNHVEGAVASSEATAARLKKNGIDLMDLNTTGDLAVYVDGADETNAKLQLIKGGGGALTREKIIAAASREFICLVDDTKWVDTLGQFPLPVEVLPMARSYIARELVKLGGDPELREAYKTDNDNYILDVYDLDITEPLELETRINQIAGVVSVGLFAHRPADRLVLARADGTVEIINGE